MLVALPAVLSMLMCSTPYKKLPARVWFVHAQSLLEVFVPT